MSAGRPPLFSNPEDLEKAVAEYFEYIKGETKEEEREEEYGPVIIDTRSHAPKDPPKQRPTRKVKDVIVVREPEPPTITGLALHLGFASRQSFYDYEERGEYSYIIKNARLRVEKGYELRLHRNNPTGSIFALKNMGWSDKQEIDQKTTFEDKRLDLSKLTDEELRTLAEIQRKSGTSEAEV
jgi:hypothetical protein